MTCSRSLGRSVARSLGRSVARSLGRSVDRSLDRSVAWSLDRSIARSLDRSIGRAARRTDGQTEGLTLHRNKLYIVFERIDTLCMQQDGGSPHGFDTRLPTRLLAQASAPNPHYKSMDRKSLCKRPLTNNPSIQCNRSVAQSFDRSIARSLDRSTARSLDRSIA